jgi:hypothetical protein
VFTRGLAMAMVGESRLIRSLFSHIVEWSHANVWVKAIIKSDLHLTNYVEIGVGSRHGPAILAAPAVLVLSTKAAVSPLLFSLTHCNSTAGIQCTFPIP